MWRVKLNLEGDLTEIVSIDFQYSLTPTDETSWTTLVSATPAQLPKAATIPYDDASLRALVYDAGGITGNPIPLWIPTKPITVQDLKDALGITTDIDDARLYRYLTTAIPALQGRLSTTDIEALDIPTGSRLRAGMVAYLAGSFLAQKQAGQSGVEKRMGTYSVKYTTDAQASQGFLTEARRLLAPWWADAPLSGTLPIPRAVYGTEEETFA